MLIKFNNMNNNQNNNNKENDIKDKTHNRQRKTVCRSTTTLRRQAHTSR